MENKYIAQATKGKTGGFKYVVGIVLITLGVLLFSFPFSRVVTEQAAKEGITVSQAQDMNYLMTIMDSNILLVYLMLPFVGGLLAVYLVVKYLHKLKWTFLTTSRSKIDVKRVLFSFLLWGGINAATILLSVVLYPDEVLWNFDAQKFAILFVIAVALIPIQTSFEEYVFRGYLMQGLGWVTKTSWFPLVFTSVAFGLLHLSNPEVGKLGYGIMAFYIGTGFLLGIVTLMDEGMELTLGFHAANNLITALLVTTDWTAFRTHAVFRDTAEPDLMMQLGVMLVFYPLLIFIFSKKYNWKNWKEKLI